MKRFEGYERRAKTVEACLEKYGFASLDEILDFCTENGLNVDNIVRTTQPAAFESAVCALGLGAAIAIKKNARTLAEITDSMGEGLQAFCVPGSIADKRQVGRGHAALTARLLDEDTRTFCFLAGHESFAAAHGAAKIASYANLVRKNPLRIILNGLGKEGAYMIARVNGLTYIHTSYDHETAKLTEEYRIRFSDSPSGEILCYGADDLDEGVAIMHHENVDVSITGNGTNPVRFQNPVAGIYQRECTEKGKKYFSVASGMAVGNSLHPDNLWAGPGSYALTDSMGRMHGQAIFAGSSSVPAHVDMMGFIGMGNNPLVGALLTLTVRLLEKAGAN